MLVVLAIVAASAACSSGDDAAAETATTTAGSVSTTGMTDAATAVTAATTAPASNDLPGIGDPVQDEQFVFVVTAIEEPGPIYNPNGSTLSADEAAGTWFVVHMSVENTGDSTQPFMTDDQKIIWNGEVIETPFSTWNASNMEVLDPGTTIDDVVVMFDVPVDFSEGGAGAVLEVHYSAFSDGVKVGL